MGTTKQYSDNFDLGLGTTKTTKQLPQYQGNYLEFWFFTLKI